VHRHSRFVIGALLCAQLLSACFTGERPTLSDPPLGGVPGSATGDAATDAVLTWLEAPQRGPFTARYDTLQKADGFTSTAVVTEDGAGRRATTIGGVRFLTINGAEKTCQAAFGACVDGLAEADASNTGFNSTLESATPATRLRVSVSRAVGPTIAHTETIAGLTATCVDVPVTAAVIEIYCALQNGVIARWDAADLHLELTSFEQIGTETEFTEKS
jgi:hypothetical protein